MTNYEKINQLHGLKQTGALSEEEFQREKEKLLSETPPASSGDRPWGIEVKSYCMLMHLSQLLSFVIPFAGLVMPIVMWSVNKDKNPLIDANGKVLMNWIISSLIYGVACGLLILVVIGIPLFIALLICELVFCIIGGVKANNGEVWKYPMSIAFLK
jgi:uncharacterized protein